MSTGDSPADHVPATVPRDGRLLTASVAILLCLIVGACGALNRSPSIAPGTIIDGFPIVGSSPCGTTGPVAEESETQTCPAWTAMAALALDAREPGHPPIVGFSVHLLDYANRAYFAEEEGGSRPIMVMRLEDETLRAVAIDCDMGPCRATDDAPLRRGSELTTRCRYDTTKRSICQEALVLAHAELETRLPEHGAIAFTHFAATEDTGRYVVDFVLAHGPDLRVTVDCTAESCTVRSVLP
jgi:hypothetical protein